MLCIGFIELDDITIEVEPFLTLEVGAFIIIGAPPPAPAIAVSVCILGKILPEPEGTNNSGPASPTRIGSPAPTGDYRKITK